MISHILTRAWSGTSGTPLSKRVTVTAGAEINLDEELPVGANQLVAFALDVSQAKSLFIVADGNLTLKTNSSGSPVNTIDLVADVPFLWMSGDPPLRDTSGAAITTDITALYLTNATADPVAFQLRCLLDPTV